MPLGPPAASRPPQRAQIPETHSLGWLLTRLTESISEIEQLVPAFKWTSKRPTCPTSSHSKMFLAKRIRRLPEKLKSGNSAHSPALQPAQEAQTSNTHPSREPSLHRRHGVDEPRLRIRTRLAGHHPISRGTPLAGINPSTRHTRPESKGNRSPFLPKLGTFHTPIATCSARFPSAVCQIIVGRLGYPR